MTFRPKTPLQLPPPVPPRKTPILLGLLWAELELYQAIQFLESRLEERSWRWMLSMKCSNRLRRMMPDYPANPELWIRFLSLNKSGPSASVKVEGPATIFQDVTLGPQTWSGDPRDGPTLAADSYVYPGARVLGQVRVGRAASVGPNCVVFWDVPDGSTVLPPEPTVIAGLRQPTPATVETPQK